MNRHFRRFVTVTLAPILVVAALLPCGATFAQCPAPNLTLTPEAQALGFRVSTAVYDVPPLASLFGPLGVSFDSEGRMLVTNSYGELRRFPAPPTVGFCDSWNSASVLSTNLPGDALGLVSIADPANPTVFRYFMPRQITGDVIEVDVQTGLQVGPSIPIAHATGAVPYPPSGLLPQYHGHVFVSQPDSSNIVDVAPFAMGGPTVTTFASAPRPDNMAFSTDGTLLFVAQTLFGLRVYDVATKAHLPAMDVAIGGNTTGVAVGLMGLEGRVFVSTISGGLWMVDYSSGSPVTTLIATYPPGGNRISVDYRNPWLGSQPSRGALPSLLVSHLDQFVKVEFVGGGFFGPPTSSLAGPGSPMMLAGSGNVDAAQGPPVDVLTLNGSSGAATNRVVSVPRATPITVALAEAPAGPPSADYCLWVYLGVPADRRTLNVDGNTIGNIVNPSPFEPTRRPQPFRCVRGGLPATYRGNSTEMNGPAAAPWSLTKPGGFNGPTILTFQALLQDSASGNPSGLSVTNAVILHVR